jgi:hypothetical protein
MRSAHGRTAMVKMAVPAHFGAACFQKFLVLANVFQKFQ